MVENNPAAARDTDKMIRQLSLVAYLMSKNGRRVDAESIRRNVEGYGHDDTSWETFTRNFHRDREELARLGIQISHERDEFGEGELYWLPPENYFLPSVEFSREELAALGACLSLLEGQFAYGRLLRLALMNLALGSGNTLEELDTNCYSINLSSSGYDEEVSARQKDIENAYSRRKTIVFDYHALSSGKIETRVVDPYTMMLTRGDWYLVGYSHERQDIRIFKISRIQGKIRMHSKREHNFDVPDDFRVQDYLDLEPWQLGPVRDEARITFSPRIGWQIGENLSHCGTLEMKEDGSVVLRTGYSDEMPLCSLVLQMHGDASIEKPPGLRRRMTAILKKLEENHRGAAPDLAKEAENRRLRQNNARGRSDSISDATQVPPERFAEMAATIAYLMDCLDGEESVSLPAGKVMSDLGYESRKAMEQAMDLIRLVNFCGGGYVVWPQLKGDRLHVEGWPDGEAFRRPAHLSPREARAMLLAIDLVGGQVLGGRHESLKTAREKILAAAGGLDEGEAIAVGKADKGHIDTSRIINEGLTAKRLVEIEYLAQKATAPECRKVEPYLVTRTKGQWYLVAWCRERGAMRTFRFDMIKSARLLDDHFEPRDPSILNLERFTRNPRFPSGKEAPNLAEVWFAPELAERVREKQSGLTELADGSLLGRIPFFDEDWMVSEVLKYCGQAVLISPAGLRQKIAGTAAELGAMYT